MMAMESVQLEVRVPRPVGAEASLPKRSSLTTERRRSFTMESLDATSLPWHQVDMAELSSEDGSSCGASPASSRSESPEMTRAMAMGVPLKHSFALGVKVIVANSLKDGTQVSILNQGLNDDNAEAIVELLKQKRVTKLLLANNALGDASAIKVSRAHLLPCSPTPTPTHPRPRPASCSPSSALRAATLARFLPDRSRAQDKQDADNALTPQQSHRLPRRPGFRRGIGGQRHPQESLPLRKLDQSGGRSKDHAGKRGTAQTDERTRWARPWLVAVKDRSGSEDAVAASVHGVHGSISWVEV
jgi:hypothetical protein